MRKFISILLLFQACIAKAQIGLEDFYPEKDLKAILLKAKKPAEKLDAAGMLATHYKTIFKDSLAALYLDNVNKIAAAGNDVKLEARAMWWDNRYEEDTTKVNKLLQFARQNKLARDEIIARLDLAEYYIHNQLSVAGQNALEASALLNKWKTDTTQKDSVKLTVYEVLTHVYIHKKDGVNSARYLLLLQDYARQDTNESLKIQAMDILGWMYFEWFGQEKKAQDWMVKVYDFHKRKNNKSELLKACVCLGMLSRRTDNKELCKKYFDEAERLVASIQAYGYFQHYIASNKYYAGITSYQEYFQLMDNHFNSRLFLPAKEIALDKAMIYFRMNRLDSLKYYLSRYKEIVGDSAANRRAEYSRLLGYYYLKNKDFDNAILIFKRTKLQAEKEGDRDGVKWLYLDISKAYIEKEDYKSGYEYLLQHNKLRDSLEGLGNREEVAQMEMEKQVEIQEAELAQQKIKQEAEKAGIAYQNKIRLYSLLAGVLILLTIAGILWRNNRRKQRDKLKIEQSYQELKATQAQLIQSEKMASLGELTAGIAHEIQNPLNFVNNFSEVNKELLAEMTEEIDRENYTEVKTLAQNILANEEKINHHGRRADAIVKGMLQHSRSSSGVKEPTDINALADEYLRLSYHGLRAKDKTFNATLKTDFDETIGNINIIPQDMGRVILNLITNAFYSVNEKKKAGTNGYDPTVTVSTRMVNNKVAITVADNGNGIPQKIMDKVFQPFYTTKPSGEGTGLGLSMSYDIVTKGHGGELSIQNKEGEGASFIITLPK